MKLIEKHVISQEDVCLFAEAVTDPNPIHQNMEAAKEMGLPGPIAHGMYVYCYLLRRLDEWTARVEKESSVKWELAETKCRFHEFAIIGHTFESVVELSEESVNEAKVHLTLLNSEGKRLTHILAILKKKSN